MKRYDKNNDRWPEEKKEFLEIIRESRTAHKISNIAFRVLFYSIAVATPGNWNFISHRERWQFLLNRRYRIGLLEDSILSSQLYFPGDAGDLRQETAPAGRWVVYDFHRRKELGRHVKNQSTGRLNYFLLDGILHNRKDQHTPTGYLDFFDVEHLLQFESRGIGELVQNELVEQTTYRKAFERANVFQQHAGPLASAGIEEMLVYQVTPKGNGLIFVSKDTGEKDKILEGKKSPFFLPI
ncbi:TPA: hypothetical protein HA231_02595 [Candidatus Woesearchaeota archaeon]|nr:hypothetical protein [Candidatus Woesearchaeota archaeon]